MGLYCLGLSHKTAEVGLREKLSRVEEQWVQDRANLPQGLMLNELVVLSTCNRVELYYTSEEPLFEALEAWILENNMLDCQQIRASMYTLTGLQVASHLLRVAAGLDSMVLGEPQVLGQVTEAYARALADGRAGKVLSRLFQACIHAGKRVRTETKIGRYPSSIPAVAASLVERHIADLTRTRITLLGAGEMAELAIGSLQKRGARHLRVVSRSLASACKLADRWQGEASTFEDLSAVLRATDVLITSSSAPHYLIFSDLVSEAISSRPDDPLVIIDIAVPRDVEPSVGQLPNVHLFDIDALSQDLDEGLELRQNEIPRVEAILMEEYSAFRAFLDSLTVVPVIVALREYSESIRCGELEKTLRGLGEISEEQGERIRVLTQSIVNKILHQPTINLHHVSQNGDAHRYVDAVRTLFGLEQQAGEAHPESEEAG